MKPDRTNACLLLLQEGWVFNGYGTNDWKSWMELITQYKFTLIPHSHALDSYRMMEVLLMGGIPVIRRSTISSCYDSSDNASGNTTRGSLPIVIVNTWSEVTKEFLESEWLRIAKVPSEQWDVSRLLLSHWVQRLRS